MLGGAGLHAQSAQLQRAAFSLVSVPGSWAVGPEGPCAHVAAHPGASPEVPLQPGLRASMVGPCLHLRVAGRRSERGNLCRDHQWLGWTQGSVVSATSRSSCCHEGLPGAVASCARSLALQCRAESRRSQCLGPGMPGQWAEAIVPSDLGPVEGGAACCCCPTGWCGPPGPRGRGCRAGAAVPGPQGSGATHPRRQLTAEGSARHRRPHCLPAAPGSRPTPQTAFSSGVLWEPRWQERRKEQPRGLGVRKRETTEREREGESKQAAGEGDSGRHRGKGWEVGEQVQTRGRGGDETEEISKDKKGGKEHQRRYEKGEESTERETEKHGGLVSTSPGGSLSPSPVGHPCPSSTHRGKKGGRPFPAGQRLANLCLMYGEPEPPERPSQVRAGAGKQVPVLSESQTLNGIVGGWHTVGVQ